MEWKPNHAITLIVLSSNISVFNANSKLSFKMIFFLSQFLIAKDYACSMSD